ncbi:MAG: tail fiber domain-containing protein [Candidatus Pacearchaeota archaeon]|nr:tail fiber domain-containing protein [Candidatus Pacearchaeota archaeon]
MKLFFSDKRIENASNNKKLKRLFQATFCAVLISSSPAFADCTSPAGPAGRLDYFSSENVFKMCDGTNWVKWAGRFVTGGAPTSNSASVAGNNTEIQFNNSGAFGASSNMTWNGTTFAITGNITYTGTIADVSDRRKKENIKPLTSQLDKITRLQGVSFTMKDDEGKAEELGLIAQDVEDIFPELVIQKNGTYALNYVGLIAPMVEGIKEMQEEISDLKAENHKLSRRISVLEGKIRPPLRSYND